jgi:hypothetical protein
MLTTMFTSDEAFTILVTVPAGTPSRDWLRVANKRARRHLQLAGFPWTETNIVVELPEAGRYFYKAAGALGLGSVG